MRLMKNILLPFFFLAAFSYAQENTIQGIVIDQDNQPIPYATVMIQNTSNGTTTDENGAYSLSAGNKKSVSILISSIGYTTERKTVTLNLNGVTQIPDVVLTEKQEQLNEVIVEGHQDKFLEREPSQSLRLKTELAKLPQNIQVIGKNLLQDQQVTTIMDGLTRNVSGVTMLEHWGNFARINMRGFRLPAFRNGVNVQDSWGR